MLIPVYIIDAFTDQPFKGNPAAVCLPESPLNVLQMQNIASEMNLSETAFVLHHPESDDATFSVRYFTPTMEIGFCGHATFAAAKLLLEKYHLPEVFLSTQEQLLLKGEKEGNRLKMRFPLYDSEEYPVNYPLLAAIGISDFIQIRYAPSLSMLVIEVKEKDILLNLSPDFNKMLEAEKEIKEVVVTSRGDENYDFFSRCFCPWIGINEDPVTGAAASVLARYWQKLTGKDSFTAYQCSKRGGFMDLQITSESAMDIVSDAKIILEGTLTLTS